MTWKVADPQCNPAHEHTYYEGQKAFEALSKAQFKETTKLYLKG